VDEVKPGNIVWFREPKAPTKGRAGTVGETAEHIPGAWRVIDKAPEPTYWWLQPANPTSRSWAAEHPTRLVSGCVKAAGRTFDTDFTRRA
jgi:hypothetical protein